MLPIARRSLVRRSAVYIAQKLSMYTQVLRLYMVYERMEGV